MLGLVHSISMPRYLTAQQFGRTMRLSIWAWLLWTLPIYLAMELGVFLTFTWYLNKTVGELVGPYLAFALPWAIVAPLIWWLRMLEEQGTPPKPLARGWLLTTSIFFAAVMVAALYSAVELHLIDPKDALGAVVVAVLLSVPSLYFVAYRRTLKVISARAAGKRENASSN